MTDAGVTGAGATGSAGADADRAAPGERARRFDALYERRIDPWDFRGSDYERAKYAATLEALPRARYRRAVEAGCSIGELARALAARADATLGIDVSAVALDEARRAHAGVPGLEFALGELPDDWPDAPLDLAVLSEVLYYLSPGEIDALGARVARTLEPGGHCVVVCWLGDTGEPLDGEGAADRFARALADATGGGAERVPSIGRLDLRRTADYRLDLFERR